MNETEDDVCVSEIKKNPFLSLRIFQGNCCWCCSKHLFYQLIMYDFGNFGMYSLSVSHRQSYSRSFYLTKCSGASRFYISLLTPLDEFGAIQTVLT